MTPAEIDHDGQEQRIKEQQESFVDQQRDDAERSGKEDRERSGHLQKRGHCEHGAAVEKAVEVARKISEVRQQGRPGQEKCRECALLHAAEERGAEDDIGDGNHDREDDQLDRENRMKADGMQRQKQLAQKRALEEAMPVAEEVVRGAIGAMQCAGEPRQ